MKPTKTTEKRPLDFLDDVEFDFSTRAYLDFNHHLDEQLEQLVRLWQHLAAPAALRVGRGSLRPRSK